MSVVVFGATGQVGRILAQVDGVIAITRAMADFKRPADCAQLISDLKPKAVINAAGIHDPAWVLANEAAAYSVNAVTPMAIARACADIGIPIVQFSGVDVFDGKLPMPYIPSDAVSPVTALGRTFQAGEQAVIDANAPYAILRTSHVFGSDVQKCLSKYMGQRRDDTYLVPQDCLTSPTSAVALAEASLIIAGALSQQPEKSGLYHLCGAEDLPLSSFVQILCRYGQLDHIITPVSQTEIYESPRWLPNTRMDCRTTKAVFGIDKPDFRRALSELKIGHYISRSSQERVRG